MKPNVIGPALEDQTPEEFYNRVCGLYKAPDVKADQSPVKGIKISWNKLGVATVKSLREQKVITEDEMRLLCKEYEQNELAILELLTKRGFAITNTEGLILNAKPKRQRTGRKPKYNQTQGDAHLGDDAGRETACADQLLIARPDSDVHAESVLQPEVGSEE